MYHVYIGALRPQPGSFNQTKKCHLTPPTAASEVRDLDFGKLKKAYSVFVSGFLAAAKSCFEGMFLDGTVS